MPFTVGLDLGQQGDFSALALLSGMKGGVYEVPTLHRWQLGVTYADVGKDVARFLRQFKSAELVVDATGVGAAVVELVQQQMSWMPNRLIKATITGGNAITQVGSWDWHVSKRQLVSVLSAVVHGGRLKVAEDQPEAQTLIKEMSMFKAKININTGNESFEAWRERDHDDLVLAVALAAWRAERPRIRVGAI